MITFNEIELDEIPFIKIEFDNSLNFDPFDVNLRVLLFTGTEKTSTLERPILVSSKEAATKLFGEGGRVEALVEAWYRKTDIPLHVFTYPTAGVTLSDWQGALSKAAEEDKAFDIVIITTNRRAYIRAAAAVLSDATLKDGSLKPLVLTAFQISPTDAISFMTDPKFVFPTPEPSPGETEPQRIGGRIPLDLFSDNEISAEPNENLRSGFDGAILPNLENLSILVLPQIKSESGSVIGSDPLLAISYAAAVAKSAQKNPSRPFNGLPLQGIEPFSPEDSYSRKELNDCVKNGLSVCSVNADGKIVLERVVTTRRLDSRGEPDYSLSDVNVNLIDNYLKKTFVNYFWNAYVSKRALLVDDNATIPANVDFPVIKPKTAKAEALNVFRIWQEKLVVQDEDAFLESLKVERDGKVLKFSFKARYVQGLLGIAAKIYRAR